MTVTQVVVTSGMVVGFTDTVHWVVTLVAAMVTVTPVVVTVRDHSSCACAVFIGDASVFFGPDW